MMICLLFKIAINNLDDFEIDAKSYITDINELIKIEKSNKITNHKKKRIRHTGSDIAS